MSGPFSFIKCHCDPARSRETTPEKYEIALPSRTESDAIYTIELIPSAYG
ncbi:MAG: hypothetical protein HQ509_03825 [Candidatus Marinimicrobia bacterium]|nr:hypothetical protein [Candidatus Neomarinimicrobiota bacterium]